MDQQKAACSESRSDNELVVRLAQRMEVTTADDLVEMKEYMWVEWSANAMVASLDLKLDPKLAALWVDGKAALKARMSVA